MKNIFLFIFDILCLPITLIRVILIYFFGSRYGIDCLDIMMHANNKYFNQLNNIQSIDVVDDDIRVSVYKTSRIDFDNIEHKDKLINIINEIHDNNNNYDDIYNKIYDKIEETVYDEEQKLDNISEYTHDITDDKDNKELDITDNKDDKELDINININAKQFIKKKHDTDEILTGKMNEQIRKKLDFMSLDEATT